VLAIDDLDEPDLIIGLAREHVREAVVLDNSVLARTFTLKELVRLAEQPGGGRLVAVGESVRAWALRLSGGRGPGDLLGEHPEDDVADPIGRSRRAYEDTAREIGGLVDRLLGAIHPEAAHGRASA
jgi:protein-tyrosine phosphatase